jgi:hypothetical protein
VNKTVAISIVSVDHPGGLVRRVVSEAGVLPGATIMVPADCCAVLTAGGQATVAFEVGPHDLELMQFNRQPSGQIYSVGCSPDTHVWYPQGTPYKRSLTLQVADARKFVQEMVLTRGAEETRHVYDRIFPYVDQYLPAGSILANPVEASRWLDDLLGQVGLRLLTLVEEAAVAPSVAPAPVAPVAREASSAGYASTMEMSTPCLDLVLTDVWASSTMDFLGKGELTLRVRLLGRERESFDPKGPFTVDLTREWLSPEDWLAERTWQDLPADALRFPNLRVDFFYRLFLLAEERDPGSVDALGTLEVELGQPQAGVLELGPTEGGKRGQYVRVKAQFA